MAVLRKTLQLENYLLPLHFENLGKLLLLMSVLWGYFVFNERLTVWYGNEPPEMAVFWATQRGDYAPFYWTMVVCNFVLPLAILSFKPARAPSSACVIASFGVRGRHVARALPDHRAVAGAQAAAVLVGQYSPRPVELLIMAATFAAMVLLYTLFAKFVPIISIWEMKAGDSAASAGRRSRRMPDAGPASSQRERP